MTENKMSEVAKLLGVELGEEFKIDNDGLSFKSFKYKLDEEGLIFWEEGCQKWLGSEGLSSLLTGKAKIIKLPKQILTDAEKRYLSNVIEPFRDRVMYVIKRKNSDSEYIAIHLEHYTGKSCRTDVAIVLPEFEQETMYKGMKPDKEYTLEELGL